MSTFEQENQYIKSAFDKLRETRSKKVVGKNKK